MGRYLDGRVGGLVTGSRAYRLPRDFLSTTFSTAALERRQHGAWHPGQTLFATSLFSPRHFAALLHHFA